MHTFTFTVPLSYHELDGVFAPKTWLTQDGGSTENEAEAAKFTFRTNTTYGDDLAIELALDDLTGGVGNTVDLQRGVDNAFSALAASALTVWQTRHPDAEEKPTDAELNELLRGVTSNPQTPEEHHVTRVAAGFERMQVLLDNLRVAALWPVIRVAVPPGWEDFATKPLPDSVKAKVVATFKGSRDEAQSSLGK
jgi:hypothetical protein